MTHQSFRDPSLSVRQSKPDLTQVHGREVLVGHAEQQVAPVAIEHLPHGAVGVPCRGAPGRSQWSPPADRWQPRCARGECCGAPRVAAAPPRRSRPCPRVCAPDRKRTSGSPSEWVGERRDDQECPRALRPGAGPPQPFPGRPSTNPILRRELCTISRSPRRTPIATRSRTRSARRSGANSGSEALPAASSGVPGTDRSCRVRTDPASAPTRETSSARAAESACGINTLIASDSRTANATRPALARPVPLEPLPSLNHSRRRSLVRASAQSPAQRACRTNCCAGLDQM